MSDDNRRAPKITLAEIGALLSILISIVGVGYVTGIALGEVYGNIDSLGLKVAQNTKGIESVSEQSKRDQTQIIERLKQTEGTMETIRIESKSDRIRIIDELKDLNKIIMQIQIRSEREEAKKN